VKNVDAAPNAPTYEERRRERRARIVAHRATSYADAEAWDLDFWQRQTPQARLSALVAIRRDVELARAARESSRKAL
jgi:hypothetical protein